jgi:hypothetical protein
MFKLACLYQTRLSPLLSAQGKLTILAQQHGLFLRPHRTCANLCALRGGAGNPRCALRTHLRHLRLVFLVLRRLPRPPVAALLLAHHNARRVPAYPVGAPAFPGGGCSGTAWQVLSREGRQPAGVIRCPKTRNASRRSGGSTRMSPSHPPVRKPILRRVRVVRKATRLRQRSGDHGEADIRVPAIRRREAIGGRAPAPPCAERPS